MLVFIGILIGIACAALGFLLYEKIDINPIGRSQFEKEQAKIAASLQKKRDDFDLQLQKDFNVAAQANQKMIDQLKDRYDLTKENFEKQENELKINFQKEQDQLKQENQRLKEKLQADFENKQIWYTQQEQNAALARSQANEAEIARAAQYKSESLRKLEKNYKDQQEVLRSTFEKYSADLKDRKEHLDKEIQQYEEKQNAIIEQFKKDEENKQKQDFYRVKLNDIEKKDVAQLKRLALEFSKPEIIFKLLYEVYYKTRLEEMFKRVLGENKDKGGIYKITNINNQKIYIGRTAHFIDRWRTHSKRGCNIDRIAGQLYDAMFEEGLENFTFEIVEICSKEEQPQKEKYWIKFYKSDEYGFNSNKGG